LYNHGLSFLLLITWRTKGIWAKRGIVIDKCDFGSGLIILLILVLVLVIVIVIVLMMLMMTIKEEQKGIVF
jgi:hypothetical protein